MWDMSKQIYDMFAVLFTLGNMTDDMQTVKSAIYQDCTPQKNTPNCGKKRY